MKNKSEKVAAILKGRRQQKEQVGGSGGFNPVHYKATHGEDPESPNQYKPKKTNIAEILGNTLNRKAKNIFASDKLPSQRAAWQHKGQQTMKSRYTEEEVIGKVLKKVKRMKKEETTEKDLGRPDTGGSTDTVTVNPKLPELKGQLK